MADLRKITTFAYTHTFYQMKVIKNTSLLLLCGLLSMSVVSCKKEKKTDNIITKIKPKTVSSRGPQQLSNFEYKKQVEWLGSSYTISIKRHADKNLPMVTDSDGKKYYDNKVEVVIMRADGTEFFKRTFQKNDFKAFTDNKYGREGAFIGFMFDKVEGEYLKFGASVGSPDPNSDEFITIDVTINKMGTVKITSSIQLDTDSDDAEKQPQGKPKTELEMAEDEGM